jgi:hypothetical protein
MRYFVTGPDIEPVKFVTRREAKNWCAEHAQRPHTKGQVRVATGTRERARCASAAIGAERLLRVKRKGRTGFKPSGLRDELPDLPVPSVN